MFLVNIFSIGSIGTIGNFFTIATILNAKRNHKEEFKIFSHSSTPLLIHLSISDMIYCAGRHFSITNKKLNLFSWHFWRVWLMINSESLKHAKMLHETVGLPSFAVIFFEYYFPFPEIFCRVVGAFRLVQNTKIIYSKNVCWQEYFGLYWLHNIR